MLGCNLGSVWRAGFARGFSSLVERYCRNLEQDHYEVSFAIDIFLALISKQRHSLGLSRVALWLSEILEREEMIGSLHVGRNSSRQ